MPETRVELRNGAYAVLSDPEDVSERKRRPLTELAARAMGVKAEFDQIARLVEQSVDDQDVPAPSAAAMEILSEMSDLVILALVKEWSFGEITRDVLLDLPGRDYDQLRDATAPLFNEVMPDFSPKVIDGDITKGLDTGSPSQPLSA